MSIFKAYDIRGIYPSQLDEISAFAIGNSFGQWLKKGVVAVGRDMRTHGPSISQAFISGLLAADLDVVDIGLCSTPMLNFAVAHYGLTGGAMVTASHNPAQYNGFKLCREDAIPLSKTTGLKDLETMASGTRALNGRGVVTQKSVFDDYFDFCKLNSQLGSTPLKIIVDCGNGIAGPFEYEIVKRLFPDTMGLYTDPDGTFPNHEPNPLVDTNLADLQRAVLAHKADIGLAFDGDADRIAFVDEKGQIVPGDVAFALLAQHMTQPGDHVLYDIRSSWVVKEEIEKAGGIPIVSVVGHAFIKQTLRDRKALIGGEVSGHFYFKDFYYIDCAIYGALKILELLSKGPNAPTLSSLIDPLLRYPKTGEVNFIVSDADQTLANALNNYSFGKVSLLDGVTVEFDDWWFNLRKSNTEPLVRLNLQAKTQSLLDEKYKELLPIIGGTIH